MCISCTYAVINDVCCISNAFSFFHLDLDRGTSTGTRESGSAVEGTGGRATTFAGSGTSPAGRDKLFTCIKYNINENPFISPIQSLYGICTVCIPNVFSLLLSGRETRPDTEHDRRTQPAGGGRLLTFITFTTTGKKCKIDLMVNG